MSLRLNRALTAHPQCLKEFFFSFCCVHTTAPKSCCCDKCALFTFLLSSLAFILRFHGISSALSVRPQTIEQWLMYNSKRYYNACSILQHDVDDFVKSNICEYQYPTAYQRTYMEFVIFFFDVLTRFMFNNN